MLCHGYTGVKDLYLPDNARVLAEAGYVVLAFDYKGWGESEGPRTRLAPYSRVADVQAALTFLGAQDEVDERRLGIYGTSYGGATVVWTGAVDRRVRCVVSVVGIGHGERWMRSVRRPDEWVRPPRAVRRGPDQAHDGRRVGARRAERGAPPGPPVGGARGRRAPQRPVRPQHPPPRVRRRDLGFHPEWIVDRIAPRPILFITTDDDRLVPPEESQALYDRAGEPQKLVVLEGYGHYEVYTDPAFTEVMDETVAWFREHLPPR